LGSKKPLPFPKFLVWEMESGFDPLKVKVRENPAWVALGGEVPSLTIPFHRHLDMEYISRQQKPHLKEKSPCLQFAWKIH
jgi:hypothetical protein